MICSELLSCSDSKAVVILRGRVREDSWAEVVCITCSIMYFVTGGGTSVVDKGKDGSWSQLELGSCGSVQFAFLVIDISIVVAVSVYGDVMSALRDNIYLCGDRQYCGLLNRYQAS